MTDYEFIIIVMCIFVCTIAVIGLLAFKAAMADPAITPKKDIEPLFTYRTYTKYPRRVVRNVATYKKGNYAKQNTGKYKNNH
jgi:hypothetical protein